MRLPDGFSLAYFFREYVNLVFIPCFIVQPALVLSFKDEIDASCGNAQS